MKTVKEVSRLTGVSIRTLHYYDSIGLLRPTQVTESGYRLYDETALERLQYILLFRELRFSLKEINGIMSCPSFDRNQALDQQIKLLQLQKEHIENLIDLARGIQMIGVQALDFSAFTRKKLMITLLKRKLSGERRKHIGNLKKKIRPVQKQSRRYCQSS